MEHVCVGVMVRSLMALRYHLPIYPEVHDPSTVMSLFAESPLDGVVLYWITSSVQVEPECLLTVIRRTIVVKQRHVVVRLFPIDSGAWCSPSEFFWPIVASQKVWATPFVRKIFWCARGRVAAPPIFRPAGLSVLPDAPPSVRVVLAIASVDAHPLISSRRLDTI